MIEDINSLIMSIVPNEDVDTSLVEFLCKAETQHVLSYCNLEEVPEGLQPQLVEIVAGKYLLIKKDQILGDTSDVCTSIKEGDVTVNFSAESPASRLQSVIDHLTRERDLLCYRKLTW